MPFKIASDTTVFILKATGNLIVAIAKTIVIVAIDCCNR